MKLILIFSILTLTLSVQAQESCEDKVIGYHKATYHRTYAAASNTFLNNFIGRKNLLAHTFAYPELAFHLENNTIAMSMLDKAEKKGISSYEIILTYREALQSGELCEVLGEKYKKPRKIRSFIFQKLNL